MPDNHLQFFTATVLEWKHLLKDDSFKEIIIGSMNYLVKDGRCRIYGFVIMPNHIHLLWQIAENRSREDVQRDFLKFTAHQLKFELQKTNAEFLEQFRVNAKDRTYQIWERNPLSVDIWTDEVMWQKLEYIHHNPVHEKWKLAVWSEDYKYSSARFYFDGRDDFDFLTHVSG